MTDFAVLTVITDGYLGGNRMAITRSTVTTNMLVTEAVKNQCPKISLQCQKLGSVL